MRICKAVGCMESMESYNYQKKYCDPCALQRKNESSSRSLKSGVRDEKEEEKKKSHITDRAALDSAYY